MSMLSSMLKSKFQIFVENVVLSFLTLIKVVLLSKFFIPKIKFRKNSEDCIILGNGPSLIETIEKNKTFLIDKDLFAVNFFARTNFYSVLKPKHYINYFPGILGRNFF